MKRKFYTREEKAKRELLNYLTRRQFLEYGIKSSATLAIPSILSTMFGQTATYAALAEREATTRICHIHTNGGPLEYVVPREADGRPLGQDKIGEYGVLPSVVSADSARTLNSTLTKSLMGISWFNRSRTDTVNGVAVTTDDFIVSLERQARLNASVAFDRVHGWNVVSDSDDDDANSENNFDNVCSAGGFRSKLVDAIAINGGVRASQGLKYAFNPFSASSADNIQRLIRYAPAFENKSQAFLGQFTASLEGLGSLQTSKLFKALSEEEQNSFRQSLAKSFEENKTAIDPLRYGTDLKIDADQGFLNAFAGVVPGETLTNHLTFATGLEALCKGLTNYMGYSWRQGMDYHQNDAVDNGNGTLEKDRNVGALIGAVINIAFYRKVNLLIILTKDGCCRGFPDHQLPVVARQDNGERTSQVMIYVNGADTVVPITRVKQQIGARRPDTGQVDNDVLVSKSDIHCSAAIGATILYLNQVPIPEIRKIYPLFGSDADVLEAIAVRLG